MVLLVTGVKMDKAHSSRTELTTFMYQMVSYYSSCHCPSLCSQIMPAPGHALECAQSLPENDRLERRGTDHRDVLCLTWCLRCVCGQFMQCTSLWVPSETRTTSDSVINPMSCASATSTGLRAGSTSVQMGKLSMLTAWWTRTCCHCIRSKTCARGWHCLCVMHTPKAVL